MTDDPHKAFVCFGPVAPTNAGPLDGWTVGVKDIFDTADLPTEYGSPIYAGHQPRHDAGVVAQLRASGATIAGKTVTTEFAYFSPGPTTNPHDSTRTPGGSSSGSAAAVAAGMVRLAIGTQTAGSMIRPASFCGVVGFKPTFGLVPTSGLKPFGPSLDTVGWYTTSVDDAVAAFEAITGRGAVAPHEAAPRAGLCRTPEWDQADRATQDAVEHAAEQFGNVGDVDDKILVGLASDQQDTMLFEGARALRSEYLTARDLLTDRLRTDIETGLTISPQRYDEAQRQRREVAASLDALFGENDVLLAPSAVGEAPLGIDATGDPLFNRIWTFLGAPVVNVPGFIGPAGMPVGVSVVAKPGDDAVALAAARWMEERLR